MITENQVREVAENCFAGYDLTIARANGGWPSPCGWQVTVEVNGNYHATFFHEDNDYSSVVAKMVRFSEVAFEYGVEA